MGIQCLQVNHDNLAEEMKRQEKMKRKILTVVKRHLHLGGLEDVKTQSEKTCSPLLRIRDETDDVG